MQQIAANSVSFAAKLCPYACDYLLKSSFDAVFLYYEILRIHKET